ncbi:MAG: hypothetical protein ABI461_17125 [Polyangiaceae bacterium]
MYGLERFLPTTWRVTVYRHLRAVLFPLVVALPPLAWVVDATHRVTLTTLGRDQGIFQYVAWAIMKGAVDYRDVRDVNGPLTHLIHMIFLVLGGADEHRFRTLDAIVTGFTFAFFGACLPGILRKTRVLWTERLAWAFAAWVVLSAQLLQYIWWDLAQRETFFDWFLLTGVGVQLVAQRNLSFAKLRRDEVVLILAGALSAIPWFGKPTFCIFTVGQALAILVDDQLKISRFRAFVIFCIGCALGALTQLAFLFRYGDARAFFHIQLVDVPAMYRFMMPRTASEILSLEWGGGTATLAFATSAVLLALLWDRQIPRRFLGVALLPLFGMVSVLAQSKGFPYHFHPVTMGIAAEWLLIVAWLVERFRFAPRSQKFARLVPFVAAMALALKVGTAIQTSTHVTNIWILGKGEKAEDRETADYFAYFKNSDFFPWELRQTAAYLRAHTKETDTVQTYGMDPYVLFLAQRLSASPYIYVSDLNSDAALSGSWMPNGIRPNTQQGDKIREIVAAHEADMLAHLEKNPPAAFVFFDGAPLTSESDAEVDFAMHCPHAAPWMLAHYRKTAAFGPDQVWMRNDLAEGVAASPNGHEGVAAPVP